MRICIVRVPPGPEEFKIRHLWVGLTLTVLRETVLGYEVSFTETLGLLKVKQPEINFEKVYEHMNARTTKFFVLLREDCQVV